MNALSDTAQLGQSLWLDNLSRTLLHEGGLQRLIKQDGISGITSNPSIFHKAISESPYYREDLAKFKTTDTSAEQRYEALVIPDIQTACDLLRPIYDRSAGDDGYVSLEVSPQLAYDEEGTVRAGLRLYKTVNKENVLIKIPATPQGVRAFERLIGLGINVNVTLMFSLHHELQVAQAYIHGLRNWVKSGGNARKIKAVASIFLSRVDSLVDKQLDAIGSPQALALRGKTAVSMAKLAYQRYMELFHRAAFADLAKIGARPQYLLWASTGTKNPQYSDLLYVEPLIGKETVNTMPDSVINAMRDHGKASATLTHDIETAQAHLLALEHIGIDLHAAGEQLQVEGVKLFEEAYTKLLALME